MRDIVQSSSSLTAAESKALLTGNLFKSYEEKEIRTTASGIIFGIIQFDDD
jgi:hypothetical protein